MLRSRASHLSSVAAAASRRPAHTVIAADLFDRPAVVTAEIMLFLFARSNYSPRHEIILAHFRLKQYRVAGYVLSIEGKLFQCFNNAQWRREFEADLAKTHPPQ